MAEGDISQKKGGDLFKEVIRLYPVADVEDYFKLGQWKDDLMRVDIELIVAHRKEAGAPEPPALSEVKMPPMPTAGAGPGVAFNGMRPPMPMGARPTVPAGFANGMVRPTVLGGKAPSLVSAQAGGVATELRLIALFVAKWRLDTARTKLALAKLPPLRRRHIVTTFKALPNLDPTSQLLNYISQCERTGSWGGAPGSAPAPVSMMAGVKRPMPAGSLVDPSKRPRLIASAPMAQRPMMASARPMGVAQGTPLANRIAAMRAQRPMMGMQRPQVVTGAFRPSGIAPVRPAFAARPMMGMARPAMGGPRPAMMMTRPGGMMMQPRKY